MGSKNAKIGPKKELIISSINASDMTPPYLVKANAEL